jgi:hypothetical protein
MRKGLLDFDLMMVAVVVAGLIFLAADGLAQQQHHPSPSQEDSLKKFLQDYVRDPFYDYKTARYRSAFVDLKDDGTHEVIVYFTDQHSCGSGGCTALILAPKGSSYEVVASITIVRLPIRVLTTKSKGWHDISVWVAGGGIQPGYEAKLSFDGKTFPSNPTVPPARRITQKIAGEVVIPATEEGTPLF